MGVRSILERRTMQWRTRLSVLQLALAPVWRAYEAALPGADSHALLQKMVKGLGLSQVRLRLSRHTI